MYLELVFVGLCAGVLSGFFGVGGGTITVPFLIFLGFDIKSAIAISAFQMSFSSVFGSYLNQKNAVFDVKQAMPFLLGGAIGGVCGGFFMSIVPPVFLAWELVAFLLATMLKLFLSNHISEGNPKGTPLMYVFIGLAVGTMGSMVGIGGALLLTPILLGYLNFSLKQSIAISLFFVVSTSIFATTSMYIHGFLDLSNGIFVALPSLFGVYVGISLAAKTNPKKHKFLLLFMYLLLTSTMVYEGLR